MKVHEAAKALGVTPRALRFYEEKGLIAPAKESRNGYRTYSRRDLDRLRWIVALRELSMPLAAIRQCLDCEDEPELFVRRLDQARSELYAELTDIVRALSTLDDTMETWRREGAPRLEDAELAAARLKQGRELRNSWSDPIGYDALALRYREQAPLAAHAGLIEPAQYERVLQRAAEWLDPRPGEAGIEPGAGSGNLSILLHAAGARLTLVEQSAEMLTLLRERLPQADARAGNLLALPVGGQSYSFAACTFAFHHLTRPQQLLALAELDRVLLPGGRMAIAGIVSDVSDAAHADGTGTDCRAANARPAPAATPNSPKKLHGGLHPSSVSELTDWLERHRYSVVSERIADGIALLYAAKN